MGRRVAVAAIDSQVRARRLAAGLSQQGLAERCGLTRQAVSAIEGGQYIPNTAVALRLGRILGCTVEDLFRLPSEPPRIEAELLGEGLDAGRPTRVQLARVGERMLARPLTGPAAPRTAADGFAHPVDQDLEIAKHGNRPVAVDLLVEPELIEQTVVVLGCDPSLALLSAHLSRRYPALRLVWVESSSLAALQALARHEAHAAGIHLWDPEASEYNLPYVRRELAGRKVIVVTLSQWQQGLIVAHGNPKGITGVADLSLPEVAIVNREPGSGSRVLLDARLREAGIAPNQVRGYGRQVPTHLAVAEAVARGAADAGPGILAAARALGLDFVPLQEERNDLVIPSEYVDAPPVQALLELAVSPTFCSEVEALGGYDSSAAGHLVAEVPA